MTDKKTSLRYLGVKKRLSVVGCLLEGEMASVSLSFLINCSSIAGDVSRGGVLRPGS